MKKFILEMADGCAECRLYDSGSGFHPVLGRSSRIPVGSAEIFSEKSMRSFSTASKILLGFVMAMLPTAWPLVVGVGETIERAPRQADCGQGPIPGCGVLDKGRRGQVLCVEA
jgi:hypothetical protein